MILITTVNILIKKVKIYIYSVHLSEEYSGELVVNGNARIYASRAGLRANDGE